MEDPFEGIGKPEALKYKDFLCNDTQLIILQRHAIHIASHHRFHIVHPYLMMDWLHLGQMPELVEN